MVTTLQLYINNLIATIRYTHHIDIHTHTRLKMQIYYQLTPKFRIFIYIHAIQQNLNSITELTHVHRKTRKLLKAA